MSYSIREGVEDAEKRLRAERAIAERFPDARLGDQINKDRVWMSESAGPHVTDIELVPDDKGSFVVYTYLTVEGMRVYAYATMGPAYGLVWLHTLRDNCPDAYRTMVDVAARQPTSRYREMLELK
jgi:hypothetical protein